MKLRISMIPAVKPIRKRSIKQKATAPQVDLSWHTPSETHMVGPLTVEERKEKVRLYLEKKHNKHWSKRINYTCRKQVADKRLRIKGRFVTRD